jgi:predicted RND superfamily exporter protein
LRLRWLIVLLWAAAVVGSFALYLARFQIGNSVGIWFLEDDPELVAYRDVNRVHGETEWTFALVRTGSIHTPTFLRDLAAAVGRMEALDDGERVLSIANPCDSEVDAEGTLQYLPILRTGDGAATREELARFRQRLEGNPIFAGNLYRPDDERHTAILIQNANRLDERSPYRVRLVDDVRPILADYPTNEQVALAGATVINAELNRAAKRDMLVY